MIKIIKIISIIISVTTGNKYPKKIRKIIRNIKINEERKKSREEIAI